jgi:soluble P-type ATPase
MGGSKLSRSWGLDKNPRRKQIFVRPLRSRPLETMREEAQEHDGLCTRSWDVAQASHARVQVEVRTVVLQPARCLEPREGRDSSVRVVIPGRGTYEIENLVLDMNGTIALDGELLEGVEERLALLRSMVRVVIITADTHGGARRLEQRLGLETIVLKEGDESSQKVEFVRQLGAKRSLAIGNGSNDALMLKESAIGVCVIGEEGASTMALLSADMVVRDVRDALDLLLKPRRLVATLRA